jgi:GGDEF domain-containing protein
MLFVLRSLPTLLALVAVVSGTGAWIASSAHAAEAIPAIVASTAWVVLTLLIFVRQNRALVREYILHHLERAARRSQGVCSAIKFDVDLLVAINDYSFAVGSAILRAVRESLREEERSLRTRGVVIESIVIPESDETIWVLPEIVDDHAADIADSIRRDVKRRILTIPNYSDAKEHVIRTLTEPPLTPEEQDGVGTVSAGVAGFTRGAESLLSDISSAVKASKFRGRNRTVIYRRNAPFTLREH